MTSRTADDARGEVGDFIEKFEVALERDGHASLDAHLPAADHPGFLAILCELIRVDLELRWARGERPGAEEYRARFPALFLDGGHAEAVAFEVDRLRRQADGGPPSPAVAIDADPVARAAAAYRDFRVGKVLGFDDAAAASRVPEEHADLFRDIHRTDPGLADRLALAISAWPEVGSDFLGFHLDAELGRGTFGRVFLARQGDLADRPVALKVAPDIAGESRVLAQLRHTNVVPIYSVHRGGAFQAVCMPYLGSTTLADVIDELGRHDTLPGSGEGLLGTIDAHRSPSSTIGGATIGPRPATGPSRSPRLETLRGLGYVDAVLWIGRRLAEGLAHAHERGILHRDLKPANVLFADDGEPMLLDFNLAADIKRPGDPSVAMVGGTLPYMAPEQLAAFAGEDRAVDLRADLYSLGVILFQLLTGRHPFETRRDRIEEVLRRMIEDRAGQPPSPRGHNPAVSPAVDAIVRQLLEPDPRRRYRSAPEVDEDLRRQLEDLPLLHAKEPSLRERARKWGRRHPRLSSSTSVALLGMALAAGLGSALWAGQLRVARLEAVGSLRRLVDDRDRAELLLDGLDSTGDRIAEGIALCRSAVGPYGFDGPAPGLDAATLAPLSADERRRARGDLGDLHYFWARALRRKAEATTRGVARDPLLDEANRLAARAELAYGPGDVPRAAWTLRADLARLAGLDDEARRLLDRASRVPLDSPRARLLEASEQIDRGGFEQIEPGLAESARLSPTDARTWLALAEGHAASGRFDEARRGFDAVAALRPGWPWVYLRRGLAGLEAHRPREAEADFDRLLALRPDQVDARINRALARLQLDDARGAVDDLTAALAHPDAPPRAYFIRAAALDRLGDPKAAARDRDEGRRREPQDDAGWVARGLSRLPSDPAGALSDIEQALRVNPRSFDALQDKAAILSENLGRLEDAVAVLDRAIGRYPGAVALRAGRGVLLARLGRRAEAHEDARVAQRLDATPATLYQLAGIFALTSRTDPGDLRDALRLLAAAIGRDPSWLAVVPGDPDLEPIRNRPEFRKLIEALAAIGPPG